MTSDDDPRAGEKYLAGLEGDPTGVIPENWTSADFDPENWTSAEFDDWFNAHVESSGQWNRVASDLGDEDYRSELATWVAGGHPDFPDSTETSEFEAALDAFAGEIYLSGWKRGDPTPLSDPLEEPGVAFSRLGRQSKLAFFRGWYESGAYYDWLDRDSGTRDARGTSGSFVTPGDEYIITVPLPDGSVVEQQSTGAGGAPDDQTLIDRDRQPAGSIPVDHEPLTSPARPTSGTSASHPGAPRDDAVVGAAGGVNMLGIPISRGVLAAVTAVTVIVVLAIIGANLFGGADDGSDRPASSGGDRANGAGGVSSAGTVTAGGSSAGVPAAAGACEAAHARQELVELSSPDVQPSIPRVTYIGNVDAGFPSPRFEWSAMPPETTEIAILVQSLRPDRAPGYQEDDHLWWRQEPVGVIVWLVTGIDPAAQSLPVTSLTNPPPGDAIEHQHENGRRNDHDQQFWIQQDDRPHLFTVFALCDPQLDGTANDYSPYWLRENAVAAGWFFSSREQ